VVFVTGWGGRHVPPTWRALGDPTELSEERRLAYVGITRARQRAVPEPGQGSVVVGPADAQFRNRAFLREIPTGTHRLAPHGFACVGPEARQWANAGRYGRARDRRPAPHGRRPKNRPLDHAWKRATRVKPRQVWARGASKRSSGVGESAMSLIDFGSAGRVQADAQPRAHPEALTGLPETSTYFRRKSPGAQRQVGAGRTMWRAGQWHQRPVAGSSASQHAGDGKGLGWRRRQVAAWRLPRRVRRRSSPQRWRRPRSVRARIRRRK